MLWWTLRDLKADDWRKREGAVRKLASVSDPRIIDPLVATLKDKNPHVRQSAGDALVRVGEPAVRPLVTALKSKHSEVRLAAQDALVKIGTPAVTALGLALYERDLGVREAAATTLGKIGDDAAMEQLVSAIKHGEFGVKEAAAAGLVRLGAMAVNALVAALKDNKDRVRETAAAALVRIGPAAIEPLVAALEDSDVREAATEALWKIDPHWAKSTAAGAAVPTFVTSLREGDGRMRKAAATVLGEVGDATAFEGLLAALTDENEGVQEAAATALGQIGDPRAFVHLVRVLRRSGTKARHAAAAALARIGNGLVEPLVEALKDQSRAVREAAAAACVRIGHSAVEPLVEALWQIDPEWAKSEETKTGVPRFVATFRDGSARLMRDPSVAAQKPADERVVNSSATTQKAKTSGVRKAGHATEDFKDAPDVKALAQALHGPDGQARAAAIAALLQIGNSTEEPLAAALKDKNSTIRRAAAHALAAAGDSRGREALRSDLKNASQFVVLDAADSLVRIGDVSAAKPLAKLLGAFLESPDENDPSESNKARRIFQLLETLLERHAEDMLVEDLHALVHFQTKRAPKFISSVDSSLGASTDELTGENRSVLPEAAREINYSRLRELARKELNRRSHKASS